MAKTESGIKDYISGINIKASPEEIDAVQPYSKILVEDYDYPIDYIITHPQYRVKVRPSSKKKEYPVDIAVFNNKKKDEESIQIIVECKKKNEEDGLEQLKDYLRFSKAQIGVWFNGNNKAYIRKIEKNGRTEFVSIPNIPKFGQRFEDIGKFKRKDLKVASNLKAIFKSIRNHLAGNNVGTTRDEVIAQQLISIIFCKLFDEKYTSPDDQVRFRAGIDENNEEISKRIFDLFEDVKKKYKEVIDQNDKINLDKKSISYVVGELQNILLIESSRDVISDAFETFIGHTLKGDKGQFFTPRNVVKMIVEILDPSEDDLIIDPACGSGGFLIESLRYIWKKVENAGKNNNWSEQNILEEKMEVAIHKIYGIDKDSFLTKVTKAYMAIIGDGKSGIFCEDSLENPKNWSKKTSSKINLEKFDILITNPPFGSKIKITGEEKLKQYNLGFKWKVDKKTSEFHKGKLKDKETPQILFIERCLQLLKDDGKMALVLPDGIFGNETNTYVRNWLRSQGKILAIIDLPLETFLPHTGTKTSVILFQKKIKFDVEKDYKIFMAIPKYCGHDRRGIQINQDDIQNVSKEYQGWIKKNK